MKVGFLFAGQGQQFKGMGQDLANEYDIVKTIFNQASINLGYDLLELCNNNPNNALANTVYTQPALLTLSHSIFMLLKEKQIVAKCVTGLSLGEYNALVAADILSFEDALSIIKERSRIMDQALLKDSTKMAAVLKADVNIIDEVLEDNQLNGEVAICNYNTFDQIVIGGNVDKLDIAINLLKEKGLKRVIKLDVSTVSHMHLLNDASFKLKDVLINYSFNIPEINFINNVNGEYQEDGFLETLSNQISHATHMAKSIELMINDGIDTFIEIGPKNALSGFVKSVAKELDKDVKILNVFDVETLNKTILEIGDINE